MNYEGILSGKATMPGLAEWAFKWEHHPTERGLFQQTMLRKDHKVS